MVRLHSSRARELPAPRPILRVLALGVNQRCQVRAASQGSAPGLVAAQEDAGIAVAVAAGELLEGAYGHAVSLLAHRRLPPLSPRTLSHGCLSPPTWGAREQPCRTQRASPLTIRCELEPRRGRRQPWTRRRSGPRPRGRRPSA